MWPDAKVLKPLLRKPPRIQALGNEGDRRLACELSRNQFAGDGAEAEAEHIVAGGDGCVLCAGDGADAGEPIGRAGA